MPFALNRLGVTFVSDALAHLRTSAGRRFGLIYRAEDSSPALSVFIAVATTPGRPLRPGSDHEQQRALLVRLG